MSMVPWVIKEHATLLNHVAWSTFNRRDARGRRARGTSAHLLCGPNLHVDWARWTEMPSEAVITCTRCVVERATKVGFIR